MRDGTTVPLPRSLGEIAGTRVRTTTRHKMEVTKCMGDFPLSLSSVPSKIHPTNDWPMVNGGKSIGERNGY